MKIDLNCDMGEGFGPWVMGHDSDLLECVTSANIACGFHALTQQPPKMHLLKIVLILNPVIPAL